MHGPEAVLGVIPPLPPRTFTHLTLRVDVVGVFAGVHESEMVRCRLL